MADKAHDLVDERLEAMEWRIRDIYEEAAKGIEEKAADYLRRFEKLDEAKRKQMEAGKITEAEYREWRQNKMLYGKRYTDLKKQVAAELANVNKTAIAYVNGQVPEIYALGYDAFSDVANGIPGYSFTAVNADTVRHLATTDSSLLPFKSLDLSKDIPWNMKRVNAEMLQGILQGESIPKMAARMSRVTDSNRAAATRAARTLVTEAENKGRQDSYERAKKDGVMLKRKWIATYDMRTRHAHAMLDGKLAEVDEPFESELGPIMFPGDHTAHPSNVYNCRCTLGVKYLGFDGKKTKIKSEDNRPLASELVKKKTVQSGLTNSGNSDKMYSGARITNIYSDEAISHAEMYYEEIRHLKTDVSKIAFVTGKTEEQIQAIKNYLFIDKSLYDEDLGKWRRFDPDFAIAQSWQRLSTGKNIMPHDLILIEHEIFESELKISSSNITHEAAHNLATQKYNYSKGVTEYYAGLARNKKKQ